MSKTSPAIDFNKDFAFLTFFLVAVNVMYLKRDIIPHHDTFNYFQVFHFYYSEFFFHDIIPNWMPYGTYGAPHNLWQLMIITPSKYFFIFIGKLFSITDVLLLYKLSLLMDKLILLLGVYLLGKQIFTKRASVVIVCLGVDIVCSNWFHQACFGLHLFYLLPMILYFMTVFFKTRQPHFLWISGTITAIGMIGNTNYFIGLYLFMLSIFFMVFLLNDKQVLLRLFSLSYKNMLFFLIFIIVTGMYIYVLFSSVEFTTSYVGGRDSATNKVALRTFLTYGIGPETSFTIAEALSGVKSTDSSVLSSIFKISYIGLTPLLFFIIAALKVRKNIFFRALSIIIISLVWLTFGGLFAAVVYFFPAMSYYRHIGHTYDLILLLILIGAGFGTDYFFSKFLDIHMFKKKISVFWLMIVPVIVLFFIDMSLSIPIYIRVNAGRPVLDYSIVGFLIRIFFCVLAIMTCYIILNRTKSACSKRSENTIALIVILCFMVEIVSFNYALYKYTKEALPVDSDSLKYLKVHELTYQEERRTQVYTSRQKILMNFPLPLGEGHRNFSRYIFVQFDPCVSPYRLDFFSAGIDVLIQSVLNPSNNVWDILRDNPLLKKVLRCNEPKLHLASNAIFVDTVEQALTELIDAPGLSDTVILRKNVTSAPKIIGKQPLVINEISAKASSEQKEINTEDQPKDMSSNHPPLSINAFNANEIEVQVDISTDIPMWLVYDDAFHPGWHVTVNGEEMPLLEANLAFKAVGLTKGSNTVKFYFNDLSCMLINVLAVIATLFIILILIVLFRTTFLSNPNSKLITLSNFKRNSL